jgi:hypothetical protein
MLLCRFFIYWVRLKMIGYDGRGLHMGSYRLKQK